MTKNNIKSKSGFTIIEVVLVLAIAGLIFLMVFIAFPGLQRSQKDTQRRNDLANLATRIIDYQTNNRNQVPTDQTEWNNFQSHYFRTSEYTDPDGNEYRLKYEGDIASNGTATAPETEFKAIDDSNNPGTKYHEVHVYTHATCDGEKAVYDASPRKVAFLYMLEAGNVYCGNN